MAQQTNLDRFINLTALILLENNMSTDIIEQLISKVQNIYGILYRYLENPEYKDHKKKTRIFDHGVESVIDKYIILIFLV